MRLPLPRLPRISFPKVKMPRAGGYSPTLHPPGSPVDVQFLTNGLELDPALKGLKPENLAMRAILWGLRKMLRSAATEDDVRDLVQAIAGVVGFAKRRAKAGTSSREALERADAVLDRAHEQLGEAKS